MKIIISRQAFKQMAKIPAAQRNKIAAMIRVLENWPPDHADIKKLKGRPEWRMRVGSYRVIFEVLEQDAEMMDTATDENSITVTQVVKRDDRTYS